MQGPHTVEQVMAGLRALDAHEAVEVIIIARGGGSMEDLLPFSDETLARAVFHCRTPVVSAIGHETDTPILDLVADVRASTPTDAAKRVVPDAQAEAQVIATGVSRLRGAITRRILSEQQSLDALRSRPVLRDPGGALALHAERLGDLTGRLRRGIERSLERERGDLGHMLMRVRALSPQATLQRGYAIVTTDDGRTVSSIEQVEPDEIIVARLIDGDIAAAVVNVEPHNHDPQQEES